MSSGLSRMLEKDSHYVVLLALLFIVAFAIPIIFAANISQHFYQQEVSTNLEKGLFEDAFSVFSAGDYIQVKNAPQLEPTLGEDFLFLSWIRVRNFPEPGERVVLVAKIDADHVTKRGFTFGFMREEKSIHPIVHWRDRDGHGRSHVFSELPLLPRTWIMLGLSFIDDRYLGVHAGFVPDQGEPYLVVLGGYELDPPVLPSSDSDLYMGALKNGMFRGRLGPFGILSRPDLGEDLTVLLERFLEKPLDTLATLSSDEVRLWSDDGKTDRSSFSHHIEQILSQKTKKRAKRSQKKEDRAKQDKSAEGPK